MQEDKSFKTRFTFVLIFLIVIVVLTYLTRPIKEIPEEFNLITLVEGTKMKQVREIKKDGFCPKVGDIFYSKVKKYPQAKIYAVYCEKDRFIFKVMFMDTSFRMLVQYKILYHNKIMYTLEETAYKLRPKIDKYDPDKKPNTYMVQGNKVQQIMLDKSYFYEPNEEGIFEVQYERVLDNPKKNVKGDEYYSLYKYDENNQPLEMIKDGKVPADQKQEIKMAKTIFEAYDKDYNVINSKKIDKKVMFPSEQLQIEKDKNSDRDFILPYTEPGK